MPNGEARGILAWRLVWRGLLQRINGTKLTESRSVLRAEGATNDAEQTAVAVRYYAESRRRDEPVLFDVGVGAV